MVSPSGGHCTGPGTHRCPSRCWPACLEGATSLWDKTRIRDGSGTSGHGTSGPGTDRWTRPNTCTPCDPKQQSRAHLHGHPPAHLARGRCSPSFHGVSSGSTRSGLQPQQPHLCPRAQPGIPTHWAHSSPEGWVALLSPPANGEGNMVQGSQGGSTPGPGAALGQSLRCLMPHNVWPGLL